MSSSIIKKLTVFSSNGINSMFQHRRRPLINLIRRGDPLEWMFLHAALLHQAKVPFERGGHYAEKLDQGVAQQRRGARPGVENFFGGSDIRRLHLFQLRYMCYVYDSRS